MHVILRWMMLMATCLSIAYGDSKQFYISLHNFSDGSILLEEWENNENVISSCVIGKVLVPALRNNPKGYRDSGRSPDGTVIASAANGLHIKVGTNAEAGFPDGRGVLVSILPTELQMENGIYQSYRSLSSSILTNINAGTSIFGMDAPYVGNHVFLRRNNKFIPIPVNYVPKDSDFFFIEVKKPEQRFSSIVFENMFGGRVFAIRENNDSVLIATVYKPVMGTGRFDGSIYIGKSLVRANHHGVIDISVVPKSLKPFDGEQDLRGGIQIVPSIHAMDPEMMNARVSTQWLVVGPLAMKDPPLDGTPPLFAGYIKPGLKAECRIDGGPWEPLPELYGRHDTGFCPQDLRGYFLGKGSSREIIIGVTHIRILLEEK